MHQDKIIGILTGGLMGSDPYHPLPGQAAQPPFSMNSTANNA